MTNTIHQVIGAMKSELSGKEVASMQGSAPQEVASMGKPTHPPPPRQLGTCIATKKVGAAIKDHNQGGISTQKTWEECLELCCKDIQCKSFDYVSTSGNCYISHNKWDEVGQQYRKENKEATVSYNEIEITPLPLKTPKKSKRVAFRTEMGGYISVDQQGQLTCGSFTLDENAIFDLVRPIETGRFNKFENC